MSKKEKVKENDQNAENIEKSENQTDSTETCRTETETPEQTAAGDAAQDGVMRAELDEFKDKYLRLYAEYENFRRRSKKEREMVYSDATAYVITSFLPMLDSLERAAATAPDPGFADGINQILKQLGDILKRLTVEEINPQGQPFDPELHEALMHVEDETLGENVVAEVLQKGYRLPDKVIRHAMVKVAN